jgi:hypothetical protein
MSLLMKAGPMKKSLVVKQTDEEKRLEYAERLVELEAELHSYPGRTTKSPPAAIPSVTQIKSAKVRGESVVQFTHHGKNFAVGHTDSTFPGTNHTRGVRRIHFYDEANEVVLAVIGEFENQQFGANFRYRELKTYTPGPWEKPFLTITSGLRTFRADRKEELRRSRAAENRRAR